MIVMGVTGSIGMGKSTAASMLSRLGVPVHDSDAEVHTLLKPHSPAWEAFQDAFPYFSYPQIYSKHFTWARLKRKQSPFTTSINRKALGALVFNDAGEREKLEAVLHPHVQRAQNVFIKTARTMGRDIVALDIPLLFETGAEKRVDFVVNISAPPHVQSRRVLARPNMSPDKFKAILARQMSDGEKSARADFVVHSGLGRAKMMRELKAVLVKIRQEQKGLAA